MKNKYIYTRSEQAKEYLLSRKSYAIADKDILHDDKIWCFEISAEEYKRMSDLEKKKIQNLECFVSDKFTMRF